MPWTNHDRVPASRLAPVLYCRISKNKVQPLNRVCAPRAFVFVRREQSHVCAFLREPFITFPGDLHHR